VVWHLRLLLTNSFNKTEAAIFPMQAMHPGAISFSQNYCSLLRCFDFVNITCIHIPLHWPMQLYFYYLVIYYLRSNRLEWFADIDLARDNLNIWPKNAIQCTQEVDLLLNILPTTALILHCQYWYLKSIFLFY